MQAKYLYRPITRRIPDSVTFKLLSLAGPVMIPLVKQLQRLGPFGYPARMAIPFVNVERELDPESRLTAQERYELSLLVTFDALTPAYDNPRSPDDLRGWFEGRGFTDIELLGRNPVLMKARRQVAA